MRRWVEGLRRHSGVIKLALVLLLVGFGIWWFFFSGSDKAKDHRPQAPIAVAPVTLKDVPVYFNGLGTVQAYNTVTVHTQVDGQIMSVAFTEGQNVHAGDVLAKIDPRTYQAQYDQAVAGKAKDEATLANAKLDLGRYQKLGEAISGQVLDTQRATVRQLEATVKADQAAIDNVHTLLGYTTITSPIDGRTGIRQVDVGNVIHPGDTNGIVVITQLQPISVVFSLPQQNLLPINEQLAQGEKLQVLATAPDNKTVLDTGVLELVDNQIDATTGTIKLKSTFPNEKQMLWPGGFANVRLLVKTRKDAVTVPTVAVQRGPNNISYVFIYKPDDSSVEMRTVKVAMTEEDYSVIDDGVKDGEQVVTDGMSKLQDGSKVKLAGADKDNAGGDKKDASASDQDKDKSKHQHKHKEE